MTHIKIHLLSSIISNFFKLMMCPMKAPHQLLFKNFEVVFSLPRRHGSVSKFDDNDDEASLPKIWL
jgi:hypothetical protein